MPLRTRRQILAGQKLALAATVLLRGRARAAAWAIHEILRLGPTLLRNSALNGPVAHRFRTEEPEVWLTIDDGPDPGQTPRLLEILAAAGARASFFVIGRKVDANRPLCRRILAGGHTLENHSYTHPSGLFWAMPCCAIDEEIARCSHSIRVAAGVAPVWFRSPAGLTNACVHPAAARSWLRVAGWSAAGLDGLPGAEPVRVVARIARRLEPGAILLLHEGPGRRSAEILELLLGEIPARGFRCVIPRGADVE
ncbi:MAG: polysaccharide deacetylase family protein [Terrimicrobiaceae bacterium]|jgi:peptidoglycan/xylan/chitin deacetylase (PgdA/CDA1 family)